MKIVLKLIATLWLFSILIGGGIAGCVTIVNQSFALAVPVGLTVVILAVWLFIRSMVWLWNLSKQTLEAMRETLDGF